MYRLYNIGIYNSILAIVGPLGDPKPGQVEAAARDAQLTTKQEFSEFLIQRDLMPFGLTYWFGVLRILGPSWAGVRIYIYILFA